VNRPAFIAMLALALAGTALVALSLGSAGIGFGSVFSSLFGAGNGAETVIIREIRLPRVLLALFVGGMLGASGASLQALFRNPLTDPFITGVSSGAAFGVTAAIALGMSSVFAPAAAGALVTVWLVYRMSVTGGRLNAGRLLLTGIIMGSLLSSLTMALSACLGTDIVKVVLFLMGDISSASLASMPVIGITAFVCFAVLMFLANDMNIISGGDETAAVSGVNTEAVKLCVFAACSALTAASVAYAGVIGFAGLIVPHFVRRFTGPDMRFVLPGSFLAGGAFVLLCDTLARTLFPGYELPSGVISGIIGAPVFLFLVFKRGIK